MNNNDIKKLARYTLEQKKVDKKLASFILTNLTRRQLLHYLRMLQMYVDKNKVTISSSLPISAQIKATLRKKYAGKNLEFVENDKNVVGIRIKENDTIIDLSVLGMIDSTVDQLKANLW